MWSAGALLGYITWKRPRLALTMAAAAAVVTAPYLGFAMAALNRWQVCPFAWKGLLFVPSENSLLKLFAVGFSPRHLIFRDHGEMQALV